MMNEKERKSVRESDERNEFEKEDRNMKRKKKKILGCEWVRERERERERERGE